VHTHFRSWQKNIFAVCKINKKTSGQIEQFAKALASTRITWKAHPSLVDETKEMHNPSL
jgi:hypothetical protein